MILRQKQLAQQAGLLLSLVLAVPAKPSVNVALRTAFDSPPFLLELL
jgi:hypothetical protein